MTPTLAVFTMVFTMVCHSEPSDTITTEVLSAITHQALIVDVRTPEEFADGHYPGAINIPHETILDGLNQLGVTQETPVILYCRSGNRSGQAELALKSNGFSQAINAGGLEALLSATAMEASVPSSSQGTQ
jgi:phage shock protein E